MTPQYFFDEVAEPNARLAIHDRGDLRLAVNAIMTLDALFGVLHATRYDPGEIQEPSDDIWKDSLADQNSKYRLLRDAAYALKHGNLNRGKKVRLVRRPDQLFTMPGAFQSNMVQRDAFQITEVWISTDANDHRADEIIDNVTEFARSHLKALHNRDPL
jgi:hypothetical protein